MATFTTQDEIKWATVDLKRKYGIYQSVSNEIFAFTLGIDTKVSKLMYFKSSEIGYDSKSGELYTIDSKGIVNVHRIQIVFGRAE